MITVLAGGLALFALGLAGVLALLQSRTGGLRMAALAGVLALTCIAFAVIGDRRERRCVAQAPDAPRYAIPEVVEPYRDAIAACQAGQALGLNEPF